MKNNFFFSFSILMGLTLLFASCSRQQGAVSYHNDKLQKQSEEIETSIYTYSQPSEEVKTTESHVNNDHSLAKSKANASEAVNALTSKGENKKLSMTEKLLIKKLNKKLNPQEKFESKSHRGDDMLKKSLLVILIGLIVALIAGILGVPVLGWVGAIIIVIGLIIFLLWALENL